MEESEKEIMIMNLRGLAVLLMYLRYMDRQLFRGDQIIRDILDQTVLKISLI